MTKEVTQEQGEPNNSEYERGFIDGMQKQMQSSVDKAVRNMKNKLTQEWEVLQSIKRHTITTQDEIQTAILRVCKVANHDSDFNVVGFHSLCDKLIKLGEEKERINAKQEQGEQLARLGRQEIDCPICGGGARVFPKQEHDEPVGKFAKFTDGIWREVTDGSAGVPLYTHPKEWVGLNEYEIKGVLGLSESWVGEDCSIPDMIGFAKAIDAKLKEKNTL